MGRSRARIREEEHPLVQCESQPLLRHLLLHLLLLLLQSKAVQVAMVV
jgi:hypothetical protein|tara:strand:- start:3484 stop:3627 length:144 start_codon:yes stop_codon:yes gene_type:complete